MSVRNFIIIGISSLSLVFGQSVFNSYGLGTSKTSFHSSVSGAGSIGLVPTFHPGVSMDNPATWPGLNFTYISGSFSNQAFNLKGSNVTNQSASFNKIQFAIPIQDRFALGVALKPLNSHNSFFSTDTVYIDFEGSIIKNNKEFRSGGGIMAAEIAFALPINQDAGMGLSFNQLFGSSRDEHSMVLNGTYYRLYNIRTYSGSTFSFDFAGKLFKNDQIALFGFAKAEITDKPVSGMLYKFDLFEDSNNNYAFDVEDYPGELDVDTIKVKNIYAPRSLSFGVNASFNNNLNIFGEFQHWNDEPNDVAFSSIFKDQILSKSHSGFGLVRFGNYSARSWQDRLTLRLGIHRNTYQFSNSDRSLIENGISVGFGFKFAATGNQLDFSFRNGQRGINGGAEELFNEFTIGLSLGDNWFLRRRGK